MLLRKINAGLSLLITLLLIDHAAFMGVWMLSKGGIAQNAKKIKKPLDFLMVCAYNYSCAKGTREHSSAG